MQDIVNKLIKEHKSISTMESCTGGYIANAITNIPGASAIFKFGAVTYSNEYKIKMGVDKNIIDKYTVYSLETADEMSKKISMFTGSDYGIGVTGQINRIDPNNIVDNDNQIYVSVYDASCDRCYHEEFKAIDDTREKNREMILSKTKNILRKII